MSKGKLSALKLTAEVSVNMTDRNKKQATISHFFGSQSFEKRSIDNVADGSEAHISNKRVCTNLCYSKAPACAVSDEVLSKLQLFENRPGKQCEKDESFSKICSLEEPLSQKSSSVCTKAVPKFNKFKERMVNMKVSAVPSQSSNDETGSPSSRLCKVTDKKDVKVKHTPLELQFIAIKDKSPDCLLFVECGYKYRFFGDDAEIAAKELNIFCHLDHNFMTASIPTHRLNVHVSRLISKGYKVGVVRQMETAALKAAGENKSAPFTRKLTNIYTIGTFIDGSLECDDTDTVNSGGHLMCVYENLKTNKDKLDAISILSVDLATGEVIYDTFSDNSSRFELESRLKHIQPIEVLLPESVSTFTQSMLQTFNNNNSQDTVTRTELLSQTFFCDKSPSDTVRRMYQKLGGSAECIKDVLQLHKDVLICLQALLTYLEEFNLNKVLGLNKTFNQFSTKGTHMQLCGRTLDNLEVFVNSVDGKQEGSLYGLLNQTLTVFGGRMLRKWLAQPLMDLGKITLRQEAIAEIVGEPALEKLRLVLKGLPDLERGLTLIFHGKCAPQEFLRVCQSLLKVHSFLVSFNITVDSRLLQNVLEELPHKLQGIEQWVNSLNPTAAKEGKKRDLFTQASCNPAIVEVKQQIDNILAEITSHRRDIRLTLKCPGLDYISVLGTEFLVEVKNSNLYLVPEDWMKISSTKAVTRYHTPFIIEAYKRLNQQRERLEAVCEEAWQQFLRSFEVDYPKFKEAVQCLATIDSLYALAQVAKEQNYCRPELTEEGGLINIQQGRHPVVDVLLSQGSHQFVPNDTNMQPSAERCMLITGPNMGGKSSYIKQVALICIMAQTGCFVPAESAKLSILDAVHTRMGASDDLYKGRSTFMVELSEASEVMEKATSRSLVILDELGRGTSTHDGVAIAYAALRHFVEKVMCLTMFVTHYPTLVEVEQMYPGIVSNYHMSFYVQESEDDGTETDVENLVFLYQLVEGVAHRSYGLNVARLAGMPGKILQEASTKSKQMEGKITHKRGLEDLFTKVFKEGLSAGIKDALLKYSS